MRKGLILLGTLTALLAVLALVAVNRPWLDGLSEIEVDAPEARPIQSALMNAYDVMALVACQPDTDLALLDSVFKDTLEYRPSSEQRSQIAAVLGPEVADRAGYLSLLKAYYQGLRQPVAAVATNESGAFPTKRPVLYCPDPAPKVELKYESIRIGDQKAVVRYDDGAALQVAVLAKYDGQWFVVSIRAETLHF